MKAEVRSVLRTLLVATFAVWFGGFTFYVSFVVPIGSEILGSAREQGFITQQVTHRLNLMCAIALVFMLVESIASWRRLPCCQRVVQLGSVLVVGLLLIWLFLLHPQLDQLLDVKRHRVLDRQNFYQIHRVYLWVSTFQWFFAWIWLFACIRGWGGAPENAATERPRSTRTDIASSSRNEVIGSSLGGRNRT